MVIKHHTNIYGKAGLQTNNENNYKFKNKENIRCVGMIRGTEPIAKNLLNHHISKSTNFNGSPNALTQQAAHFKYASVSSILYNY